MTILGQMVIIAIAIVARLASTASRIAIEKDWIVVVAEGKRGKLASKWDLGIGTFKIFTMQYGDF